MRWITILLVMFSFPGFVELWRVNLKPPRMFHGAT